MKHDFPDLDTRAAAAGLIRIDAAAPGARISRRQLDRWVEQGRLRRYRVPGSKATWVSAAELELALQPREAG